MWAKQDENIEGQLTYGAKKAIEKSKEMLKTSNMSVEHMMIKAVEERFGKVKDILKEGNSKFYDAVILGKRDSYALQWMFERTGDEIAQSILKETNFYTPLWVCHKATDESKNVLVCLDGSPGSYRAVDHVGYILEKQDQHHITLFHIRSPETSVNEEKIFAKAASLLQDHNIKQERISMTTTWGINIGHTILGKVHREKYAVVAMGHHGQPHGMLKAINLLGGNTSTVIKKIENAAVWCCP